MALERIYETGGILKSKARLFVSFILIYSWSCIKKVKNIIPRAEKRSYRLRAHYDVITKSNSRVNRWLLLDIARLVTD